MKMFKRPFLYVLVFLLAFMAGELARAQAPKRGETREEFLARKAREPLPGLKEARKRAAEIEERDRRYRGWYSREGARYAKGERMREEAEAVAQAESQSQSESEKPGENDGYGSLVFMAILGLGSVGGILKWRNGQADRDEEANSLREERYEADSQNGSARMFDAIPQRPASTPPAAPTPPVQSEEVASTPAPAQRRASDAKTAADSAKKPPVRRKSATVPKEAAAKTATKKGAATAVNAPAEVVQKVSELPAKRVASSRRKTGQPQAPNPKPTALKARATKAVTPKRTRAKRVVEPPPTAPDLSVSDEVEFPNLERVPDDFVMPKVISLGLDDTDDPLGKFGQEATRY